MKVMIQTIVLVFILSVVPTIPAWAGVEIKGVCGVSDKALAQVWAADDEGTKVKIETKNSADAMNQFLGKGSDFALTETFLTPQQLKKAGKRTLLYLPVALSAQAVVYNLPGIPSGEIKLTSAILSDIFLGAIKKWNDPAIQQLNPGILLPDIDVMVLHEPNESSLNDFFPAFLARENPQWTLKREKDKNLHWPLGQNMSDNLKTLNKLRQWAGVIAVVDFSFAQEKHMPVARVKNAAGRYVAPSMETVAAAASAIKILPDDLQAILMKSRAKKAYPFATIVWAVVDQNYDKTYHHHDKGKALVGFLNGVLSEKGQKKVADSLNVSLPDAWVSQILEKVNSIQD